ncbi:amidase domain-containing protein [Clostridium carnis]
MNLRNRIFPKVLLSLLYFLLPSILFINLFNSISKTKNIQMVPSYLAEDNLEFEETSNVGSFLTDVSENTSDSILPFINDLFSTRNSSFSTGNVENLYKYYDITQLYGKYSLSHEFKRISYLRDWASERDVSFSKIESYPHIISLKNKDNIYKLTLREEYKFSYFYNDLPNINNDFGFSIFHTIDLEKLGNSYAIIKDYYLDCFQEGLNDYKFTLKEKELPITKFKTYDINYKFKNNSLENSTDYDRKSAVEYANKYCGISFANSTDSRYNPNYYTCISSCGNCTNFVSQCLSDNIAGGKLPQDNLWNYNYNESKGVVASDAWVSSSKLVNYLLDSKKGSIVLSGSLENILKALNSEELNIMQGDLITYNIYDSIEHSAIITDFDSKGYPLVNSNSIDKYKVPFDLGWTNKNTSFNIISIK